MSYEYVRQMTSNAKLRELGLFDARVPRYTSYPTAPHFDDSIGANDTQSWISSIEPNSRVSVYVHVPFCRNLCWFCACRTQGTSSGAPVAGYVETLKSELALIAQSLPDGVEIEHLHWGGGTPTLMAPELMQDLARSIFQVAPLAKGAQFSVEIDPNEIDRARMDVLAELGMNRASIGVQDFDPTIQKTIGREQSYAVTKAAVDGLRDRGINSLNMDILYGLPHQTPQKISESVQMLLSLSPDRVALYGYAHVPWMARRQGLIPTDTLPTPEERLGLFDTARELFKWDGYDEIGIDHFARPADGLSTAQKAGKLRRNFQGYTEDTSNTLIGVGASAISRFPQGYAQNSPATSQYQKAVRNGSLATCKGHALTDEDNWRGRMIEALMCDFAVDLDAIAIETGTPMGDIRAAANDVKAAFGDMVDVDDHFLTVPEKGQPLARMMARQLDAYSVSQSGHSHAV